MNEMSVKDAMGTAMWRFHSAALDRAALMYVFSRSTHEDTPAAYALYSRQLIMLIDLIHDFSFNARRAIERAEKHKPGIIEGAREFCVHFGKTTLELSELDSPKSLSLSQESFWWMLGRIIHSKEIQITHRTAEVVVLNQRTGQHFCVRQPVAFRFASDRDGEAINHYVELESFALGYVRVIAGEVEKAIVTRNYPSSGGVA